VHPVAGVLHHHGAGGIADDPVQQRARVLPVDRSVDDDDVAERGLDLVDAGELRGHPEGELESGDIRRPVDRLRCVLRIPWKVEARYGEARVVAAVEVERRVLLDDAHADDGVPDAGHRTERRPGGISGGRQYNPLPVAARPVEIACQVEMAVAV
jgi:hypothetical protein